MLDSPYGRHTTHAKNMPEDITRSEQNLYVDFFFFSLNGFLGKSFDYHSSVEKLTIRGRFQAYQVDLK